MGRKLSGNTITPTPTVSWRGSPKSVFVGKLLDSKAVKLKKGNTLVFEFEAVDGDSPFQMRGEDGQYHDVDVNAGDKVSYFAPSELSVLSKALAQANKGEVVKIVYLGKEFSPKTGREYHNFDVEIVDPLELGQVK